MAFLFTTALAFGLIGFVSFSGADVIATLGGTTALLLLAVFAVVNIAVLVLRQNKVDRNHFRAPAVLPYVGVVTCLYLVTPLSGRASAQYIVAGWLLLLGVVLFFVTVYINRRLGISPSLRHETKDLDPRG